MKRLTLAAALISLSACAHHRSILPDAKEVTVSREAPDKKCKEIGPISGSTSSAKATSEEALADLKTEAANKGINFVVIKEFSAYGTGVTGIGYECP